MEEWNKAWMIKVTMVMWYLMFMCPQSFAVNIWVKADKNLHHLTHLSSDTVKNVFLDLGYENLNDYLVTVNNELIAPATLVDNISTSENQPLVIEFFTCWIQIESGPPLEQHCKPTKRVHDFLSEGAYIPFHNEQRIKPGQAIWSLFTSQTAPLRLMQSNLTFFVNSNSYKIPTPYHITQVVLMAQGVSKCTLKSRVCDINGRSIVDLDSFILTTSYNERKLYLEIVTPVSTSYTHSQSISTTVKEKPEEIEKYSREYEIYGHWFSLEVYDKFIANPNSDAIKFSEKFCNLMDINKYQPTVLHDYENTYTAVFSQSLDRYLFPGNQPEDGCVLHQPVFSKDNCNKPDCYIVQLSNGIPSYPLLVSDFKRDDNEYDKARSESLGYYQSAVTVADLKVPVLVMPCTPRTLSLFLCWRIHERCHATVKILDKVQSDHFPNFFNALKFAVGEVRKLQHGDVPFKVEPIRNHIMGNVPLKSPNVFRCGDLVYKLLDTTFGTKTNHDVIKEVLGNAYFDDMTAGPLTKDGRYQFLRYKYISAISKTCYTLDDFKPVAKVLKALHDKGYVHSDVRLVNIVFTNDNAKLIDFDLVDNVDVPYPPGYNTRLTERYPDMSNKREIVHDRYSFIYLIKECVQPTDLQAQYLDSQCSNATDDLTSVIDTCKGIHDGV